MRLVQAIDEFFNGYFSTHERSAKTRVAYRADLDQVAAYAPKDFALISLDSSFIENWAANLRLRKYSPASMRRKVVVFKVFCSYWVRKGVLHESPFWRVKLSFGRISQLPRALSESEMRGLLTQAKQHECSVNIPRKGTVLAKGGRSSTSLREYRAVRNLALVDLLFATGMRVGEVSALNLQDFVVAESVFRVSGKGGRDRLAFVVDKQTLQIQRKHLDLRFSLVSDSSALFLNASGQRLSTQGIANIISQFRKDAGIETITIACAAVDDVTAWCLLAVIIAVVRSNTSQLALWQMFLGLAIYLGLMIFVVRPAFSKVFARRDGAKVTDRLIAAVILFMLTSSWVTEWLGIHALFGAFFAGVVMPKNQGLGEDLVGKFRSLVVVLLVPLFFALTGLRTNIVLISGRTMLLYFGLVFIVAVVGKWGGSMVAAKVMGMPWREAAGIGVLMNTRGLIELVILNIGLDIGVLTRPLFSMMVVMAVATTLMTTPLLLWLYPNADNKSPVSNQA